MSARCMKKKVCFPIAEVFTRSPRTWKHLGSWLPSCFLTFCEGWQTVFFHVFSAKNHFRAEPTKISVVSNKSWIFDILDAWKFQVWAWKHDGNLIWAHMLNTDCLETWQDLGPWSSASNTASKCPGSLGGAGGGRGAGSSEKSLCWTQTCPSPCWRKSNSS